LIYSHDGTGLGHVRIALSVAHALARQSPDDAILLLTGSLNVSAFELPANLDFVKLPSVPRREIYDTIPNPGVGPEPYQKVIAARSEIALATMRAFAPDLVVVDHAPAGLFRELMPAFDWLRRDRPESRFALLMRDITFGAEQTRTIWRDEAVYPLLDELYDRILVYGSQEIFDPIAEYAMSPAAAARTVFCGYLSPVPPTRTPEQVRAQLGVDGRRLAAVSVGGGADGGPLLRAYLEGLPEFAPPDLISYVIAGPLLPENDRRAIARLAAGRNDVVLTPFDPDALGAIAAADVAVSMAGYNSLCEAAFTGMRSVVVPRLPGPEEQAIRAERFARRGLVTLVSPHDLSPQSLWDAVLAELARESSPPPALPFGGEARIAAELAALAHPDDQGTPRESEG
jgi:predicted glycosyltransferase